MKYSQQMEHRIQVLEQHLKEENPVLLDVVKSFRLLDRVGHQMGFISKDESYATHVSWWPLISILGTFSAGKSSFINYYLGVKLQQTGNQAVDDKFTVVTFTKDNQSRTIPGRALDADPRFPFFHISRDIEEVEAGEGDRIDAYLQLKTAPSDVLRGKIIIDSPGFDADQQRTATLRITDRMIDLSDLVLIFFDARHPEPGAMKDTLHHLVEEARQRHDSNKFLYILNQIDVTAREDNPEEVVAAWQRALSQQGLTTGRFYRIYNPDAAFPIEDEALRDRFERKRVEDMGEIQGRIEQLEIERAYRIVGMLTHTARAIQERWVPKLRGLGKEWRYKVLLWDGVLAMAVMVALLALSLQQGWWQGLSLELPIELNMQIWAGLLLLSLLAHFGVRRWSAGRIIKRLRREGGEKLSSEVEGMVSAFHKNTRPWFSIFHPFPVGWNLFSRRKINQVLTGADHYIQSLNDRFTDPSGGGEGRDKAE
ncbi:MAG: dynamin family protein [Gammaproteobacteria bacterium]|nr:dynamin family protein [Gammaproteobacteria bacterium]